MFKTSTGTEKQDQHLGDVSGYQLLEGIEEDSSCLRASGNPELQESALVGWKI